MLFQALPKRVTVDVCGYKVPVLPKLENGLVLLAHINEHISEGLGLRQIIDWQCFVEREMDDTLWQKFSVAAERIGMKKLPVATSMMCRKYLGLKDAGWYAMNDDTLCDELLEYLIAHGNFGRKNNAQTKSVNALRLIKAPFFGLMKIQEIGLRQWKLVQKHTWLKPFAWAYKLCHWVKHGVQQGVTLTDVISSSRV